MNAIKVNLQRPWKFSDSPYYEYLTKNVDPEIDYVNTLGKHQGIAKNIKSFKFQNYLKYVAKHLIRRLFSSMPNAIKTRDNSSFDIIHCAHCLSKNKRPWVVDIEWPAQFWAGRKVFPKNRDKILRLLLSKHCKKVLAWTNWSREEILKVFPEIDNKIEVLYPALKPTIVYRDYKKIRLLFVSRRFYFKGGLHALEVIDRLTRKYKDVEAVFISDTPREIIEKYSQNPKIKFHSFISKEKMLEEIYPKSDILIYPSYTDTFGFVLIEALSFGIPAITVDGQSRREIINDGETGFVVDKIEKIDYTTLEGQEEIIEKMVEKTSLLIENRKLLEKMSLNAYSNVEHGRFSIKKRNDKLAKIYEEAVNK
ncbi:MAG TPA: glycosyltransferase family 4 protein [Candidatus Nanoarchaeia archaeon]|nr:glycosyltransferase family 4 protein [Candidatus Nanoarchaeia archaeon]